MWVGKLGSAGAFRPDPKQEVRTRHFRFLEVTNFL